MEHISPHRDAAIEAVDDVRAHVFRGLIVSYYSVFVGALAVLATFVPDVPGRWTVAATLGVLSPLAIVMQRTLSEEAAVVAWHLTFWVACSLVALAVPGIWVAALVANVGSVIYSSFYLPPSLVPYAVALAVLPVAIVSVVTRQPHAFPSVITAFVLVAAFCRYATAYQKSTASLRAQLRGVMASAAVVIVESEYGKPNVDTVVGPIEQLTGWSREEWIGMDHRTLIHPDDLESFWIGPQAVEGGQRFDRAARMRRPDGSYVWLREISRARVDSRGTLRLSGLLMDVTDASQALESARFHASHDALTGLPNRSSLVAELRRQLTGDTSDVVLLLLDLDGFKSINDTLGHAAGDTVLVEVARRLRSAVAQAHFVARLGGDEFAVVCNDTATGDDPARFAAGVAEVLDRPLPLGDLVVSTRASVGVIRSIGGVSDAEAQDATNTLLRRADIAMYEAKRTGAGVCVFGPELERSTVEDLMLAGDISRATERGEFVAHFQPIVALDSGRIVGAESLARWHHPTLGVLSADRFIDVMRISNRFELFTAGIVKQVLAASRACRESGMPVQFAVNVAVRSLHDHAFTDRLLEECAAHGVAPRSITVELTESEVLDVTGPAVVTLAALAAAGFPISIDDFGSGYSSLATLAGFHFDEIKLDRQFVQQSRRSDQAKVTIESVVTMAGRLGARVVAEGIESASDAELVRTVGCHTGQGYLYGKAVPLDRLLAMLRTDARIVAEVTPTVA